MHQLGRLDRLTVGVELCTGAEHAEHTERFTQLLRSLTTATDCAEQLGVLEVLANPSGRPPRKGAFEVSFELHRSGERLAVQALFSELEGGGWLGAEQLVEDSSFAIDAATGVAELEFSLPASLVEQWAGKRT